MSATVAPSRVTVRKIVDGAAPIASLIANSRVRRETTQDVTPYTPTPHRINAATANTHNNVEFSLGEATA